jgi:outer membrane protein assembly factor BamB
MLCISAWHNIKLCLFLFQVRQNLANPVCHPELIDKEGARSLGRLLGLPSYIVSYRGWQYCFRHKRGAVLSQYETERHAINHHRWMVLHGSSTHQNFVTRRMNGKWTSFWKEITQQLSITTTKIVAVSTPRVDFESDGSKFKVHNFEQVLPPVPRFTNTSEFDRSTLQLPWPKHLQKSMLQKDGWINFFSIF